MFFDFEEFIEKNGLVVNEAPKANVGICRFYLKGSCHKGNSCPYLHARRAEKSVVCKHWLRGLCKKGENCEFLHEYNLKKMPECWFWSKFGECSNGDECIYLHIDPNSKTKECAWYARGFCKHGKECRNKHIRRVICPLYMCGFCPEGANCNFSHPKFELPLSNTVGGHLEKKEKMK